MIIGIYSVSWVGRIASAGSGRVVGGGGGRARAGLRVVGGEEGGARVALVESRALLLICCEPLEVWVGLSTLKPCPCVCEGRGTLVVTFQATLWKSGFVEF